MMAKDPEKPEQPEEEPAETGLTMAQVMKHPLVREMTTELKSIRRTLDALPEVIARAVAEAQKAKRVPGIDVTNPELLQGSNLGQNQEAGPSLGDAVVQNLQTHLADARDKEGYVPRPTPPSKPKK